MIVELFGNRHLVVSEETAAAIDRVLTSPTPPAHTKINGQMVKVTEITNMWTDEQWAVNQHERIGDYRCSFGFWHGKLEKCGHTEQTEVVEPDLDLGYLRKGVDITGKASLTSLRWLELIRRNHEWVKLNPKGGRKYGPLRELAELDVLEATGEWPEMPVLKQKTKWISVPTDSAFPGANGKRRAIEIASE